MFGATQSIRAFIKIRIYISIKFVLFLDFHLTNWASYWGKAYIKAGLTNEIRPLDQPPLHEHAIVVNLVFAFIIENAIDYHEVGQSHKRNVRKYLQV